MSETTETQARERAELIASLGITMTAQFIPQSASRNRDAKEKSLNWVVTLASPRGSISADYMQGIGHVPGYQTSPRNRAELEKAAETGKAPSRFHAVSERILGWSTLPAPKLEDVLYSLVSDASAANTTFEDWCSDLGYDTDSRKAEETYRACVDIGIRLRRLVGGESNIERLSQLFQDY